MENITDKPPSYLFGPVPSRRLGISLGVDLVPYKTCTMDCVYCESGCTTDLTTERREFYPTEDIIAELDTYLATSPELDYVTFSGAGEPTLHSGIGPIISFLKNTYPAYKTCLLTNGMLLKDDDVFNEVKEVDMIVPSLDAPNLEIYKKINRPAENIDFESIVESFIKFHKESKAIFILEIFVIPGLNDSSEAIKGFCKIVEKINPDKVQLNSLDRPGAENWVQKMTGEGLGIIKDAIAKVAEVEIIGKFIASNTPDKDGDKSDYKNLDSRILDLITRRPCTVEDLSTSMGYNRETIEKILRRLQKKNLIRSEKEARGVFFNKI